MMFIPLATFGDLMDIQTCCLSTLSQREIVCLEWAAKGKSSNEIASIIGISDRGVNFHVNNAKNKLRAINRTQAVALAVKKGIIDPS